MTTTLWRLLCGLHLITSAAHADTPVTADITTDTTWTQAGSPYLVSIDLRIYNNATLTIEPGVVVTFQNTRGITLGFNASSPGIVQAQGTAAQPITFTSVNGTSASPGDWDGLHMAFTDATTILDYCVIEYGGGDVNNTNLRVSSSTPTIQNSTIRHSDGYGIYVTGTNVRPVLTGNTFDQNGGSPLRLEIANFPTAISENTYTNNGTQAIELVGGAVTATDVNLPNPDLPYVVTSTISVYSNRTLTIAPGVTLRFANNMGLDIGFNASNKGYLQAVGGPTEKITFTSVNGTSASPGDWDGLHMAFTDATTILDYCVIEYGGADANNTNLRVGSSTPTIQNSTIRHSDGYGIFVTGTNVRPVLSGNTLDQNGGYPLRLEIANFPTAISDNTYTNNGTQAIELLGGTVTASDVSLLNPGIPYAVTSTIWVYNGRTLTIAPGVSLRFANNMGLDIGFNASNKGYLQAVGSPTEKITFTANDPAPTRGTWRGVNLAFTDDSGTLNTRLEHCEIAWGSTATSAAGVRIGSSTPTVRNCEIRESAGPGVYATFSAPVLENNSVHDNGGVGISLRSGIGGNPVRPVVTGNTVANNDSYALHLEILNFPTPFLGNTYTNNGTQAIELLGGTVTASDVSLLNPGIPYAVTSTIWVYNGRTLTIAPGVSLRFANNMGLDIGFNASNKGYLQAVGSPTEKITFTANDPAPTRGTWRGVNLAFTDDSGTLNTRLEHCEIAWGSTATSAAGVRIGSSTPTVRNCEIRESAGPGVYATFSAPVLENNSVHDNGGIGISLGSGITGDPIRPVVTANAFNDNGGYPLRTQITNFPAAFAGNTYFGNGTSEIELVGGGINEDLTLSNEGIPYRVVSADLTVNTTNPAVVTLATEPGTTFKFDASLGLVVGGISTRVGVLRAQGTQAQPITFTGVTPTAGAWDGLNFNSTTPATLLDHCVIEYGGSAGTGVNSYNLRMASSHPVVQHSEIRHSSGHGISVSGGNPVITHSNITDNALGGLNASLGIIARLNWWGDASGPSGAGPGTGQSVNANVLYEPWLTAPLDSAYEWQQALSSPDPFSQIGGLTTFFGNLPSAGDWTITIKDASDQVVRNLSGTGLSLAEDWFGEDNGASPLPDGAYSYEMAAIDSGTLAETVPARGNVTLQGDLPVANITVPLPESFVSGSVTISGTAEGVTFASYQLHYGAGYAPSSWTLINSGNTPVDGEFPMPFNTSGLANAIYTVRLSVLASGGASIAYDYAPLRVISFHGVAEQPDWFSPNDDGVQDTTTISATVTWPVDWLLTVRDPGNNPVRTIDGSGSAISQIWDGRDDFGIVVPDGVYAYQLTGTEAVSGVVATSVVRQVVVDNTPPTTAITSPTEMEIIQSAQFYTVTGAADDANFDRYRLYIGEGTSPSQFTLLKTSTTAVPGLSGDDYLYSLPVGAYPASEHTLRLIVDDDAGNTSSLDRSFTLDHITITDVYNDPLSIDPIADEMVEVFFTVNTPSDLTIRFVRWPDHAVVKTIDLPGTPAGANSVFWDGRDGTGQVVSLDSLYYYTIAASDPRGRDGYFNEEGNPIMGTGASWSTTDVDTSGFDPYANDEITVMYSVNGLLGSQITVQGTGLTLPLNPSGIFFPGPHVDYWDGRNQNGAIHQGNFHFFFGVPNNLPSPSMYLESASIRFANFRAQAYLILPVFSQVSTLEYTLNRSAQVTIEILDPNGNHVRTIAAGNSQDRGGHAFEWDGRNEEGLIMSLQGTFTAVLTAVDPITGQTFVRRGAITVYR